MAPLASDARVLHGAGLVFTARMAGCSFIDFQGGRVPGGPVMCAKRFIYMYNKS